MNKIDDLMYESGLTAQGCWDEMDEYNRTAIMKFAELIIKECAEQIIAKGTDWIDFAPSQTGVRPEYWDMAQQIKEHFGVEL